MTTTSSRWPIALLALILASVTLAFAADTKSSASSWTSDLLAWRAQQAKDLQQPNGWLTLIGLEWLKPGDNSFGSAKTNALVVPAQAAPSFGIVRLTGDSLQLLPPHDGYPKDLQVDGAVPANPQTLSADTSGHPSKVTLGSVTITVIHRGDRYGLRIKDSRAPGRLQFHGLKWYPPNQAYRVHAKWIPYVPVHHVAIPTILGTEVMSDVPGAAEFILDGKTYRLEPIIESPDDKELFFILRDATSKSETYGAGRFLYADMPDHGLAQPGEVWLDFNRAENPPCAYTPYATCPLPPPQNRLPIPIPAGQQRYHE
jgi:uncharacterized protein (DUF1684 family)